MQAPLFVSKNAGSEHMQYLLYAIGLTVALAMYFLLAINQTEWVASEMTAHSEWLVVSAVGEGRGKLYCLPRPPHGEKPGHLRMSSHFYQISKLDCLIHREI